MPAVGYIEPCNTARQHWTGHGDASPRYTAQSDDVLCRLLQARTVEALWTAKEEKNIFSQGSDEIVQWSIAS